jgi:hypothetical protein
MAYINLFIKQFKELKMKNFLLIFRADFNATAGNSPEEKEASTKRWMDWVSGIATQNKLTDRGNRLEATGKVVRANNMVTNGPYVEIKEFIGGYSIVKTESYEEAVELAKSCPVFLIGGNVEVREIGLL